MGLVWDMDKEGTWEKAWRPLHDKPCRAIWAPEIHYVRGNYVICLSIAPTGISILKSATGKPEGPYVHAFSPEKPMVNGIDPTLFEDDDGKVYFTYASATKIVRLKDDLSGLAEDFHSVVLADPDHTPSHHADRCTPRDSNDLGTEGAVLFKANGRYYLGAADTYEGRYSTCIAMSDNIYGPYHTRHEPCLAAAARDSSRTTRWLVEQLFRQRQPVAVPGEACNREGGLRRARKDRGGRETAVRTELEAEAPHPLSKNCARQISDLR